jgi:integrase
MSMRATAIELFRTNKAGERVSKGWYVITRNGQKQSKRKVKSQESAERIAAQVNAEEEAVDHWMVGGALPCDETLRGWLKAYEAELSPSTAATHRASIEQHLVPFFGSRELRALSRDDIRAFAVNRFELGKSAATITNALSVLRRIYCLHIEAGILDRNPAQGCGDMVQKIARRYDNIGVREVDAWTRKEVATLLHTAQVHEPHVYPVFMAAIATGMRRGELLALRWEDIGEEEIRVRSALVRGKIKTPKSNKARSVPIYPELRQVLETLRKTRRKREGLTDPAYVFTGPDGVLWDEDKFGWAWRRLRSRCVDDAGKPLVRPLSFHCCRHTFASWALEDGRSIVWVQRILGHASAETTLRRYSHWVQPEKSDTGFLRLATRS